MESNIFWSTFYIVTGCGFFILISNVEAFDTQPISSSNAQLLNARTLGDAPFYEMPSYYTAGWKRSPGAGFYGVRGKKISLSNFYRMRGKKGPVGFLGMRGKKMDPKLIPSFPNDEPIDIISSNEYWLMSSKNGKNVPLEQHSSYYNPNELVPAGNKKLNMERATKGETNIKGDVDDHEDNRNAFDANEDADSIKIGLWKRVPAPGFVGLRGKREAYKA